MAHPTPQEVQLAVDLLDRAGIETNQPFDRRVMTLIGRYADMAANISRPPSYEPSTDELLASWFRDVAQRLSISATSYSHVPLAVSHLQASVIRHSRESTASKHAMESVAATLYNTLRALGDVPAYTTSPLELANLLAARVSMKVPQRKTLPIPPDLEGLLPFAQQVPSRVFVLDHESFSEVPCHGLALGIQVLAEIRHVMLLTCDDYGTPYYHLGLHWVEEKYVRDAPYPLVLEIK